MTQRVLLVEDDPANRAALALLLEVVGYKVDAAANGAEALDRLRTGERPCVVLLDLTMPVMDGWAVLRTRQQEPALRSVPVVVLSALGGPHRAALLSLGADDVFQKPADPEELLAAVRRY